MRLAELLGGEAVDSAGRPLGTIRDVRLTLSADGTPAAVAGVVVGDGPLARASHSWGLVEGRAAGPWPLRALAAPARRAARFVPADAVVDWRPGGVTVRAGAELPRIDEEIRR